MASNEQYLYKIDFDKELGGSRLLFLTTHAIYSDVHTCGVGS